MGWFGSEKKKEEPEKSTYRVLGADIDKSLIYVENYGTRNYEQEALYHSQAMMIKLNDMMEQLIAENRQIRKELAEIKARLT